MEYPKVVVLILSYNGKYLLGEAIASYLKNDYPNFDVVVIDNGSTDGTLEFVKENFPQVTTLRTEKNLGYSGGFNLGLDYVFNQEGPSYVLITNNDIKADKSVISELVKVAEQSEKIGFVTGKTYYYDQPDTFQTVGKHEDPIRWNGVHIGYNEKDTGQYDEINERCFIDDIYMLVSRKLYDEVGGYDSLFCFQCEEYDWQARAKKYGYKSMYTPYAKIWHKVSATIGRDSAFKAYYDARNSMLVILLHKSPTFFKRYFWFHFRRKILRSSLSYLKRGHAVIAFAKWRGFFSALMYGVRNKKFTAKHFV